jgi:phosphoribosyl-AMP cyclohydrolase
MSGMGDSRNSGEAVDLFDLPIEDAVVRVAFDSAGLVPVITQEASSGRVLMLAWMNEAAVRSTIETRRGTYFSRSRGRQWVKGETSGHVQDVVGLQLDCDGDALLMLVEQVGPACHTGAESCFDTGGDR